MVNSFSLGQMVLVDLSRILNFLQTNYDLVLIKILMFIQFLSLSFLSIFKQSTFIYRESKHLSELANKLLNILHNLFIKI